MAKFVSSEDAIPKDAIALTHIVELNEKNGLDKLLIGKYNDDSNNLYIERFHYKINPIEEKTNMGSISKQVVCKAILEKAWHEVSKDESIPLETRYRDLLELNYSSSSYSPISRQLNPLLKGIIMKKKNRRYDDGEGWSEMYDEFDDYDPFDSDEE